jgi:hypothetical protein
MKNPMPKRRSICLQGYDYSSEGIDPLTTPTAASVPPLDLIAA